MTTEQNRQKAREIVDAWATRRPFEIGGYIMASVHSNPMEVLADHIAAYGEEVRRETWNEAIMFVNIADIGDAKGSEATYKIGKILEAAAKK